MTYSLRRSLAVRFAATMAVGLVVISLIVLRIAGRVLHGQVDQSISATAFLIANEFAHISQPAAEPLLTGDSLRYQLEINRYVVVRNRTGAVLRAIPGYAFGLPLDTAALRTAREGTSTFADARWDGQPFRTVYQPVTLSGMAGDHVVQVAASLEPIRRLQGELLLALAVVVLIGTGATFAGAWRLAGSVVRPVQEITAQATGIEAGTLDQRISAHSRTVEYEGLVAVLNRMLERLDRAFRSQRRFTSDVSHELRTPLTALRGEIEVALRAERSPREYQRVLHSGLEEIDRLTTMTEELLLISRVEAHLVQPQREPVDLPAAVTAGLERVHREISHKGLTVAAPRSVEDSHVPADQELVARLIDELLENAVKYSEPGGSVRVAVEPAPDRVRLVIEDSGPGIAPQDLPHIFEPFFRADQARSRGTGTGLGLTTVAAIVRLHGGEIRAANRPEGGARIEVDFPQSPAPTTSRGKPR